MPKVILAMEADSILTVVLSTASHPFGSAKQSKMNPSTGYSPYCHNTTSNSISASRPGTESMHARQKPSSCRDHGSTGTAFKRGESVSITNNEVLSKAKKRTSDGSIKESIKTEATWSMAGLAAAIEGDFKLGPRKNPAPTVMLEADTLKRRVAALEKTGHVSPTQMGSNKSKATRSSITADGLPEWEEAILR
jgi:hypothetical protein